MRVLDRIVSRSPIDQGWSADRKCCAVTDDGKKYLLRRSSEFKRIVWCAQAAPAFSTGMVDGYFDGEVPMKFWRLLVLYICSNGTMV